MGSQLQCGSKPQHYCTYCLAGYRCCSNCHSFRLLRSLPKNREKNRLNLIFHIFNGRCAFLPYGLVCCAFLILFLVFCYLQLAECLFCSSLFLIILYTVLVGLSVATATTLYFQKTRCHSDSMRSFRFTQIQQHLSSCRQCFRLYQSVRQQSFQARQPVQAFSAEFLKLCFFSHSFFSSLSGISILSI